MSNITEGAEVVAESGKTYLAVSALGQDNVWTAVDKDDHESIVILKAPSTDDTGTSWPRFQHEMIMHELFKECSSIRTQVDRVPPVKGSGSPPILVLEIFQSTLWHARTKRPFSKGEIKAIARDILRGLQEVHTRGLVYVDLKMQNVMLNGFDTNNPSDGVELITKLGDLGIVMEPSWGKAQPVAYRAPEVYFKGAISQAADVWAFGLIYCHLLEAQGRFSKTGLYDDLYTGTGSMPEREQAVRYALANDYDLRNVDYYKGCIIPVRDESHPVGNHWQELRKRGLDEEDVEFLQWVLKADPRERPTPQAILDSHWLRDEASDQQRTNITAEGAQSESPAAKSDVTGPSNTSEAATTVPSASVATAPEASTSTPTFDPNGSAAFDSLMRSETETEAQSPVKDHPLVAAAMSNAAEDEASTAQHPSGTAPLSDSGVSSQAEKAQDPSASSADSHGAATADDGEAQRAQASHLGRQSATGGTYLSYR